LGHEERNAIDFVLKFRKDEILIRSYKGKETIRFNAGKANRFPSEIQHRIASKLLLLNTAIQIEDLRSPPGNRLERLRGDREGQHSIRINQQWRICFRWIEGNAYDVEITDYH